MTKFTHPDDVPEGLKHEWVTMDGKELAIPLRNGWWSVENEDGDWFNYQYSRPSEYFKDKPVTHESEVWVNCYENSQRTHMSKEHANISAGLERIARVRVPFTWTEDQFDE